MALEYCKARTLDILKKPCHIVPMYSTAQRKMVETVWPGISEIRTTAARTGEYAGIDEVVLGPMIEATYTGRIKEYGDNNVQTWVDKEKTIRHPEWASVVTYRFVKGERCAFHSKIYWTETCATVGKDLLPNDMWEKRPIGQISKCVEAEGLRKAFPEEVGSMYSAEEMEGKSIEVAAEIQHQEPTGSAPDIPDSEGAPDVPDENVIDAQVEEINDGPTEDPDTPESVLAELEDRLAECRDEEALQEAYDEVDIEARAQSLPGPAKIVAKAKHMYATHLLRMAEGGSDDSNDPHQKESTETSGPDDSAPDKGPLALRLYRRLLAQKTRKGAIGVMDEFKDEIGKQFPGDIPKYQEIANLFLKHLEKKLSFDEMEAACKPMVAELSESGD